MSISAQIRPTAWSAGSAPLTEEGVARESRLFEAEVVRLGDVDVRGGRQLIGVGHEVPLTLDQLGGGGRATRTASPSTPWACSASSTCWASGWELDRAGDGRRVQTRARARSGVDSMFLSAGAAQPLVHKAVLGGQLRGGVAADAGGDPIGLDDSDGEGGRSSSGRRPADCGFCLRSPRGLRGSRNRAAHPGDRPSPGVGRRGACGGLRGRRHRACGKRGHESAAHRSGFQGYGRPDRPGFRQRSPGRLGVKASLQIRRLIGPPEPGGRGVTGSVQWAVGFRGVRTRHGAVVFSRH